VPPTIELHHLSTGWSVAIALAVTLVCLGAPVLTLVRALRAHASLVALRREAGRATLPLAPGPVTLRGTVESPEGAPVVLTIRQRAEASARSTRWRETGRELTAKPFVLVLDDGERVRVEPSADAHVWVDLQRGESDGASRTVLGKLLPGDRTDVSGHLRMGEGVDPDGGYRGTARMLRLDPPREGRMRFCSVRLIERLASERAWAVAFLGLSSAVFALWQLYAVLTFWPLVTSGVHCEGEITQLSTEGSSHPERVAIARIVSCGGSEAPAGLADAVVSATVPASVWSRLEPGERLPFVVSPDRPSLHQLGAHARLELPAGKLPFAVLELVAIALVLYSARRHGRPWYEKERVIDWEAEARG